MLFKPFKEQVAIHPAIVRQSIQGLLQQLMQDLVFYGSKMTNGGIAEPLANVQARPVICSLVSLHIW